MTIQQKTTLPQRTLDRIDKAFRRHVEGRPSIEWNLRHILDLARRQKEITRQLHYLGA